MSSFDHFTRRDITRMLMASAAGVSLSGWMPRLAAQSEIAKKKGRACILLWMGGGPSQIDTFDPKPEHKNGGPVKAIDTAVPGIQLSEYLPGLAKEMKELVLFRGMTSKEGDHGRATQLMLTGYRPVEAVNYPGIGSLLAKELAPADGELPGFVSISPFRFGGVGGPGFLGPKYAPLTVSGNSADPNARADLTVENMLPPAHVSENSKKSRIEMLQFLQKEFSSKVASEAASVHRANYDRAIRMVETQGQYAFKLDEEPDALRDGLWQKSFRSGLSVGAQIGGAWRSFCGSVAGKFR